MPGPLWVPSLCSVASSVSPSLGLFGFWASLGCAFLGLSGHLWASLGCVFSVPLWTVLLFASLGCASRCPSALCFSVPLWAVLFYASLGYASLCLSELCFPVPFRAVLFCAFLGCAPLVVSGATQVWRFPFVLCSWGVAHWLLS